MTEDRSTPRAGLKRRAVVHAQAATPAAPAFPAIVPAQQPPVRIGAIARTGPWAAGAQVSQEPNYILWAEMHNAAGGMNVKGTRRPIELISSDDQSGRPDPAALGQQRQLRDRAARQPLRLSVRRADRAVAPDAVAAERALSPPLRTAR